jgi:hypothetical protein
MIRIPDAPPLHLVLGQPMIQFLVSWGPMLLLIAVWIFFMKKGGAMSYKQHVADMKQLAEAQLAEMKRTNEALSRIESSLSQDRTTGSR